LRQKNWLGTNYGVSGTIPLQVSQIAPASEAVNYYQPGNDRYKAPKLYRSQANDTDLKDTLVGAASALRNRLRKLGATE
jgi:hypothetical protein